MKFRLKGPSPAMVVALVALFVALGGTAYAVTALPKNSVGTPQLKNGAVTPAKLNKTTVASLKGPAAYAHINPDGTLDTAHSKNVSASSTPGTGIYCLKITVPVSNGVASVDIGTNGGNFGEASVLLASSDPQNYLGLLCPAGDNAIIGVEKGSANEAYGTFSVFN